MHLLSSAGTLFDKAIQAIVILFFVFQAENVSAQTAWPGSQTWATATNITSVMDVNGLTELSGLYWNSTTNRLYVSHGDGRLRVLQLNASGTTFSQIANIVDTIGPEGITQVNPAANEFYTIDEDRYEIRKYTHAADYSGLTLSKRWSLIIPPSTMLNNTGSSGPEGIAFVPDSFLIAIGFINQLTGLTYSSVKGMGGLIFIAHQSGGYVWVFDVNPNVTNDFAFVGKYKTNASESCELTFERTTGLLYILHNTGSNTLEVTDLSTSIVSSERKFVVKNQYLIPNPTTGSNINVEGFALTPKCNDSANVSIWLCRDVESTEASSVKKDCIRWFKPVPVPGNCYTPSPVTLNLKIFIQGFYSGGGKMKATVDSVGYPTLCDTITVELHNTDATRTLAATLKGTVSLTGNGSFLFPQSTFGHNYYIAVKHRNALETWSTSPVTFNSSSVSYSFTDAITKAFGNKLVSMGDGNFALFNGDTDQNGSITQSDVDNIELKVSLFLTCYTSFDLTGDKIVETSDYSLSENNSVLNITVSRP